MSRAKGSALIIVLAFIVLTAIVLLSFLASTQSSVKKSASSEAMVLTEFLAETATAAVVDDLRQEMLAGADGSDVPNVGEFMTVSQPWAMMPARVLTAGVSPTATNFFNLVKQSVRSRAFYPSTNNPATYTAKGTAAAATGRIRASAVSTADASRNNRMLSAARWNKPMLLGGSGFTATNQLPDWILISRQGPLTNGGAWNNTYANKSATNESFVIGRFAYNIYDIGGLLDINVAGFDPGASGAQTNAAIKGSAAWADLRAIPGISDPEKIVKWRNKLSTDDADTYQTMIQSWGEPNGFRKAYKAGGAIENRFFTRQELLKYAQSYGSNAMATTALPFLTTFSADTDRPSFTPEPESSRPRVQRASSAGGNDARGNDGAVNPSLLSVKNLDDDFAIKRRFPLERLKYLVPNPDSQTAEKIQKYFGLTWSTSAHAWEYPGNQILRLSAITGREPNFFELLQAAISAGSLGGQFQLSVDDTSASPRVLGRRDGSVSNHIVQIAANIIDQYDSDSYPTAIDFAGRTFYGIEDLPYLYGIRMTAYHQEMVTSADLVSPASPAPGGSSPQYPIRCVLMLQPTIWNPHAQSTVTFNGPTNFRVLASGSIYPRARYGWWTAAGTRYFTTDPATTSSTTLLYPSSNPKDREPAANFSFGANYVSFRTQPSGDAAFREPRTITSPGYPSGSSSSGDRIEAITETTFNQETGEDPTRAVGFRAGYMWAGPVVKKAGEEDESYFELGDSVGFVDYYLQYADAGGIWRTYDIMESVPPTTNIGQNNQNTYGRRPRTWARIDPRIDRFGYRNHLFRIPVDWKQGESIRPGAAAGFHGTGNAPDPDSGPEAKGNLAAVNWVVTLTLPTYGFISENRIDALQAVRYMDPDGVQRPAMGGYSSGTNGLPMALNNTTSRPVMLNRPFRSVAELGYASRGLPWKQVDFFAPQSGDAGLLDVFCLYEAADVDPITAGRVNLNTGQSEVLQALLRGVALSSESPASELSNLEAKSIADQLVAWTRSQTTGRGPLRNRSELVGRSVSSTAYSGFSASAGGALASGNQGISFRRESPVRALVDAGTTRTWTFLIDLIVQKGRYPTNATGLAQFTVEGEQRYWVHVAMDRYTGEVISQVVEAVND